MSPRDSGYRDEGLLAQRIRQRSAPGPSGVRSQASPPEIFYIYADQIGAPRVLVDAANQVRWRWDGADPFGMEPPDEAPQGDAIALPFNLRFPGQYYDRESGLHYNYFRDYDPVPGRYIQSDPIGLDGGVNTYTYVNGNPLNATDPTGEFLQLLIPLAGAATGGMFDFFTVSAAFGVTTWAVANSDSAQTTSAGGNPNAQPGAEWTALGPALGSGRYFCRVGCNVYPIKECPTCQPA